MVSKVSVNDGDGEQVRGARGSYRTAWLKPGGERAMRLWNGPGKLMHLGMSHGRD